MKLFYFDCETTGVDSEKNAIIQMSGIVEINGEEKERFNIKTRPFEDAVIEEGALKVTNTTKEEILAYPKYQKGYEQLIEILSKYVDKFNKYDKFFFVAYNAHFDVAFLRQFFLRCNDKYYGSWFWSNAIDVMVLATLFLMHERSRMPNFQLMTVAKQLNIDLENVQAHDALEDIIVTKKIYEKLMNGD